MIGVALLHVVNRFANALLDSDVHKGDVVLFQLPNCPEFIFSYLAPQKIGVVTSPANPGFAPEETKVCLESSKPRVYIYDSANRDNSIKALDLLDEKPEIIIINKCIFCTICILGLTHM